MIGSPATLFVAQESAWSAAYQDCRVAPCRSGLARIANGPDTDNELWDQLESAELQQVAEGLRHLGFPDDMALNESAWIVYVALYAYCQEMVRRGLPEGASARGL